MFKNRYGQFSKDGSEYIITNPDTPRPWSNIIANPDYGFALSHTGGGFSWVFSSKVSALTRWDQDLVGDAHGKYVYIADPSTKERWTINWNPFGDKGGEFRCVHGVGYSILERAVNGVAAKTTMFVPPKDSLEVWIVELTNTRKKPRRLYVQTYLEWLCDAWPDSHREFHRTFLETEFDKKSRAILARKRKWEVPADGDGAANMRWPFVAFHAASRRLHFATGDKYEFLGRNRTALSPAGLFAPGGKRGFGKHGDAAASLRVAVNLKPGETKTVVFVLGAARTQRRARSLIKKYASEEGARAALVKTKAHWRDLLDGFTCDTPNKRVNVLVNTWLKYQAISSRIFGKCGYYQNSGAFGFRDQLQDSQVWFPLEPKRAREHISLCCSEQKKNGAVCHWWFPGTPIKNYSNCSDDFLWLPFILIQYMKETADFDFLDQQVEFVDGGDTTVLRHALRSINRALERLSARGLPLLGDNDWNDGLSSAGDKMKGESIWLAHFLHGILVDFVELLDRLSGREHEYDDVDCGHSGAEQGGVATCVPGGTCLTRQRRTAPKGPQPFRAGCSASLRCVAAHRRWGNIASSRRLAEAAHHTPSTQPYSCSRPPRRYPSAAKKYSRAAGKLRKAINAHGWDGAWFWRATTDDGRKLGSRSNREGAIFLNAQTWAVIGRATDAERAEHAMAEARKRLYKPYGSLLLHPAYKTPDSSVGYLTQYAPGMRENGGVYTHASVWSILAEALLGNAEQAFERFSAMCPIKQPGGVELYACEPYVLPGNIDGPDSPTPGRGGWTWYTGSAAWLFHVFATAILGIRSTYDGLVIDPCIPRKWKGFRVKRNYRGATLDIRVTNPRGKGRGVKSVKVNGAKMRMPLNFAKGSHSTVEVEMG